jgi:hypothetical protein
LKLYLKAVAVVAALSTLVLVLIPSLVSFRGTFAFLLGLTLIAATPYLAFRAGQWLWADEDIKKLVAKFRNAVQ